MASKIETFALAKILLILAYLAADHASFTDRVSSLGLSAGLVIFLALYGFFVAALFLTAFMRLGWLRTGLAALLAAASVFQHAFEWTTAAPLTYEAFINLMTASGQMGEALAQHGHVLLRAVPVALLLFAGIALPPRTHGIPHAVALAAPILSLALLTTLLYLRGGEGSRALPAAWPPLSFAGLMVAEDLATPDGPRPPVTLPRAADPAGQDIVLLVDESVAANYLDINNRNGVRSGLQDPPPGVRAINYGYAVSVHDCSANSNAVLRFGGTRDNYQQALAHYPSIWAYARAAGLRTVYIDAQSTGGRLQNMMTASERAEIQDFIQFDDVPVLDRDMAAARLLAERIANGRPEFIYVNKVGAHFPIQDKFPDELMRYRPVLERGSHGLLSWSSDRTGFTGQPEEWVRYRNSYRNTLLWNVGAFFDRLLAASDLAGATIIYTSDHGQDLHERGNPGNNTHCGATRSAQEVGLVPLVVLENGADRTLDWSRHLAGQRNGLSHFRIFPTLLALMGYERDAIARKYGPGLDQPDKDPFSYNLVFNTRLGREPEWQVIDPAAIIDPPASDYDGERGKALAKLNGRPARPSR